MLTPDVVDPAAGEREHASGDQPDEGEREETTHARRQADWPAVITTSAICDAVTGVNVQLQVVESLFPSSQSRMVSNTQRMVRSPDHRPPPSVR
jgi:hypothetical protein